MSDEQAIVNFPVAGIDVSGPFGDQRPRPLGKETDEAGNPVYGRTCAAGKNVRAYEASSLRRRGGTRPGIAKHIPTQVAGERWVVQELAQIAISAAEAVE